MQALLDLGYDTAIYGPLYQELFSDKGGKCLVKTVYPKLDEVLETVRSANGVAVFAHPSVYRSMDLVKRLAPSGLIDGIEVYHPRNTPEDQQVLLKLCEENNLIVTHYKSQKNLCNCKYKYVQRFFYKAGKHSPCFEPALFHPVFSSGRGNFSVNNFFFSWKIKKPVLKKNKL